MAQRKEHLARPLETRFLGRNVEIDHHMDRFARSRAAALLAGFSWVRAVDLALESEPEGYRCRALVNADGKQLVCTFQDAGARAAIVGALTRVRRSLERVRQASRPRSRTLWQALTGRTPSRAI